MLESLKLFFTGIPEFKVEDSLSPSCRGLLKRCYGFEEDVTLKSLGIYPDKNSVIVVFVDPYERRVEVTFNGVTDASITNVGQALARNQMVTLDYEHTVDEFEVKGTCYWRDREKIFHTHILKLIAENLFAMFTFTDLTFREA